MGPFTKKNKAGSFPLAAMIDDEEEQNQPVADVASEGDVSTTENDSSKSSGGSPSCADVESPALAKPQRMVERGLTEVSRKYDRDGKGYLNETERALRQMDSKNKGFLDQDKVCYAVLLCSNGERTSFWLFGPSMHLVN